MPTKRPRLAQKRAARTPTRRFDHDALLASLLETFPKSVYLVGRYADPALGLDDRSRVFLPDFHWMSRECLTRYIGGYSFNGNLPSSRPLLATLLRLLSKARADGAAIDLFQLGDRFDLWREAMPADADILVAFDRVSTDPNVSGLSAQLDALDTKYVRGNHDSWLRHVEKARPNVPKTVDSATTANQRILVTHGHQFDSVEKIPDEFKAALVALAPNIRPATYDVGPFPNETIQHIKDYLTFRNRVHRPDLYPDVAPSGARLLTALNDIATIERDSQTYLDVSMFSHGQGAANDFEHVDYLTFADKTLTFEQNHPSDHTVHVIGHTHHARILVDRLPGTDAPHVTLDCGGWIENCTARQSADGQSFVGASAQFGVQAGNDIRIYQLMSAPSPEGP